MRTKPLNPPRAASRPVTRPIDVDLLCRPGRMLLSVTHREVTLKALFGVVSLLVALVIVGLIAVKQLKAVGQVGRAGAASEAVGVAVPQMSGSGTVREQARQLQNKVANDAVNAMNQGAAARKEESEKP